MEELKNWLIGKMLWDPTLDPEVLIQQFLSGYYGPGAALHVRKYMDVMRKFTRNQPLPVVSWPVLTDCLISDGSAAAVKYFMHEGIPPDASFLTPEVVLEAEAAFAAAEQAAADDPTRLARVKKARLPTDFVGKYTSNPQGCSGYVDLFHRPRVIAVLERWDELRAAATHANVTWPLAESKQQAFHDFAAIAAIAGVTQIRESGCTNREGTVWCMERQLKRNQSDL